MVSISIVEDSTLEDRPQTLCSESGCVGISVLVDKRTGIELEDRLIWDIVVRRRCIRSRTCRRIDKIPMHTDLLDEVI